MTDLHDFIKVRPEELIDSLADGPRAGQFNPSPEEVQELLAQVHPKRAEIKSRAARTQVAGSPSLPLRLMACRRRRRPVRW